MSRIVLLLLLMTLSLICFSGCSSGTSYQAPLPDYSSMTDEGGEPEAAKDYE